MSTKINGFVLPVDENQNPVQLGYKDFKQAFAYNASGNVQYMGRAEPGTLTNTTGWQVKSFLYDGSVADAVTAIVYASGSRDFTFDFNQRGGYVYL